MVFIFFLQNNRGQFSPPLFLFLFQIISAAKSGFICLVYGCLYIQPTCAIRNCIISIAIALSSLSAKSAKDALFFPAPALKCSAEMVLYVPAIDLPKSSCSFRFCDFLRFFCCGTALFLRGGRAVRQHDYRMSFCTGHKDIPA